MNDELEKLRPEVRNAVVGADKAFNHTGLFAEPYWQTIRAELLRLANENADYGKHAIEQYKRGVYWMDRAKEAEAEFAALKARIAGAPVYEIPLSKPKSEDGWARVIESVKNERSVRGKRVRLVVEE